MISHLEVFGELALIPSVESGLNPIDHDIAHYSVHGWAGGIRGYLPIPHGAAFAELYATQLTLELHGELGAINDDAEARWGGGARVGASVSWHVANILEVAVGGGLAFERFDTSAESGANRVTASLLADAFVRIGVL